MGKKAKKYSSEFKFKVVLESLAEDSVAEVARRYNIHPNQLSLWRRQFRNEGPGVFGRGKDKDIDAYRKRIAQLETLVGKKELEINLLKNYLDFYVPLDGS